MVTAQHETEALQIPNCQAYDGFQLRVDSFGAQEALLRLLGSRGKRFCFVPRLLAVVSSSSG